MGQCCSTRNAVRTRQSSKQPILEKEKSVKEKSRREKKPRKKEIAKQQNEKSKKTEKKSVHLNMPSSRVCQLAKLRTLSIQNSTDIITTQLVCHFLKWY
ncbi:unnamed protein product [Caenorhabditis bovis]|uniref:Uncharacterized protein n=1 Tax=Caenorhabditis bovis TaxID=2654633 RepID=A0A8S1F3U1_9PELO|nr:unnamed protein product [Caenorhabditis bovis]